MKKRNRSYNKWFLIVAVCLLFTFSFSLAFAAEAPQLKKGNLIRIIQMNVDPQKEEDFNRWYLMEHEHLLLKVPGVIWTYKGLNLGTEGPKYFFMYAHENISVQQSDQYKEASQTVWAKEIRPALKDFQAVNYEVIVADSLTTYFKKGNLIRTVKANIAPEKEKSFNDWYDTEHIPSLKKVEGVASVWRGMNLSDKGQKYVTVYFQDNLQVQDKEEYKKASQTDWIKSLFPFIKDLSGSNYGIPPY